MMKYQRLSFIFLQSLLALVLTGCATQETQSSSNPTETQSTANVSGLNLPTFNEGTTDDPFALPPTGQVVTIYATGLSCPLCASNVDIQLKRVAGVKSTQIDLGSGAIIVELDQSKPRPANEQLAEAVRDGGFTVVSVQNGLPTGGEG